MWTTTPSPKNVLGRALVRSYSWSGTTMSSGLSSSRRLPTALADSTYWTPSAFMPQMLAR
jgi:hypothetical protein